MTEQTPLTSEDRLAVLLHFAISESGGCDHSDWRSQPRCAEVAARLLAAGVTLDAARQPAATFSCCPHDHEDDSYGNCILCREYVPHTDEDMRLVPYPCAPALMRDAPQPAPEAGRLRVTGDEWTAATLRRQTHKYLHGEDYDNADRCDEAPCTWLRAALAAPAPDDAAHLAWLREGDRLARALPDWALDSENGRLDARSLSRTIIAALAGEPQS